MQSHPASRSVLEVAFHAAFAVGLAALAAGCSTSKSTMAAPTPASRAAPAAEWADVPAPATPERGFDREGYARLDESPFRLTTVAPLSTFAIDVDTASYANVRRFLESGSLPPTDAVRIEEMINYFPYDYAAPSGADPFAVQTDVLECPWQPGHRLVRVGLKAREIDLQGRPPANLVFLVDVSGSMQDPNKLPLVRRALSLLTERLDDRDRIALVVYAGASGVVLPPTRGSEREKILRALARLEAGGSTHGSAGIALAYALARAGQGPGVASRVILATDGDFNVGVTSQGELTRLIEEQARSGVFLSVLGFGTGNLQDATLEALADRGNGNYAYIDSENEARKALVQQLAGTLVTVAKDVKIQVEWNPARVSSYRLLGYENRALRDEDFLDDAKDAGEIGAGHTVTALYEIVPAGEGVAGGRVEPLIYQTGRAPTDAAFGRELATVKLRWKAPDGSEGQPLAVAVAGAALPLARAPADARFAAAVASFGMLLRDSPNRGDASFESVLALAKSGLGADPTGIREGFVSLVKRARTLHGERLAAAE